MTSKQQTSDEPGRPAPRRDRLPAALAANVDLLLALAVCAAMGIALLVPPFPALRLPLALLFVAILPGYTLDRALWPEHNAQDFVERAALSVALSLGLIAGVVLGLNVTPWGIHLGSLYPALCVLILASAAACFIRRRSGGPPQDATVAERDQPFWRRWGVLRTAGLTAAVALLLAGAAFAAALRPQDRLTEFSVYDAQGAVADYPSQVQAGRPITLPAAVVNHEGAVVRYRVLVQAAGTQIGRTAAFTLADGNAWNGSVSFTPQTPGRRQEIDLLLLKDGASQPCRRLTLWMRVDPATPAGSPGA